MSSLQRSQYRVRCDKHNVMYNDRSLYVSLLEAEKYETKITVLWATAKWISLTQNQGFCLSISSNSSTIEEGVKYVFVASMGKISTLDQYLHELSPSSMGTQNSMGAGGFGGRPAVVFVTVPPPRDVVLRCGPGDVLRAPTAPCWTPDDDEASCCKRWWLISEGPPVANSVGRCSQVDELFPNPSIASSRPRCFACS